MSHANGFDGALGSFPHICVRMLQEGGHARTNILQIRDLGEHDERLQRLGLRLRLAVVQERQKEWQVVAVAASPKDKAAPPATPGLSMDGPVLDDGKSDAWRTPLNEMQRPLIDPHASTQTERVRQDPDDLRFFGRVWCVGRQVVADLLAERVIAVGQISLICEQYVVARYR